MQRKQWHEAVEDQHVGCEDSDENGVGEQSQPEFTPGGRNFPIMDCNLAGKDGGDQARTGEFLPQINNKRTVFKF